MGCHVGSGIYLLSPPGEGAPIHSEDCPPCIRVSRVVIVLKGYERTSLEHRIEGDVAGDPDPFRPSGLR